VPDPRRPAFILASPSVTTPAGGFQIPDGFGHGEPVKAFHRIMLFLLTESGPNTVSVSSMQMTQPLENSLVPIVPGLIQFLPSPGLYRFYRSGETSIIYIWPLPGSILVVAANHHHTATRQNHRRCLALAHCRRSH
jgi:hypothetical protein